MEARGRHMGKSYSHADKWNLRNKRNQWQFRDKRDQWVQRHVRNERQLWNLGNVCLIEHNP
jgi:hypothetical protein